MDQCVATNRLHPSHLQTKCCDSRWPCSKDVNQDWMSLPMVFANVIHILVSMSISCYLKIPLRLTLVLYYTAITINIQIEYNLEETIQQQQ